MKLKPKNYYSILLLFIILMNITLSLNAQNIKAKSNPTYQTFGVSEAIQRLLFIKEKGNLVLPERGFYLDLSEKDATKLDRKTIAYIPLNGDAFYGDEPEEINLSLYQLSVNDGGLYYSLPTKFRENSITKKLFDNPSLKDTISRSDLHYGESLEFTKEWIEMLDNNNEIMVHDIGCAATTDGYKSIFSVNEEKMSDLAKARLHYVTNLFPETSDEWSKKQWQKWFQDILNFREPTLESCNKEVYNMEWYFNPSNEFSTRYATNSYENYIGVVESVPFYEDYKNQQFVLFDQKINQYFRYALHTEKTPFKEAVNSFVFFEANLFILTENFKWAHFQYNKGKDIYDKVALKPILPSGFLKEKETITITNVYKNDSVYFVLFAKNQQDINQYFVASFITKTGQLIAVKSLPELTKNTALPSLKNMQFETLSFCNNDQNYFVVALENEKTKDAYFLKINADLENTKAIQSQIKLDWHEFVLTTKNEIVHIRNEYDSLQRYFYKDDLSEFKKSINTKINSDVEFLDNSIIVKDGENIRLFAEYRDKFANGIKQEKINMYGKTFVESCVYFDVPLEELSSDNQKILFFASPNNKGSFTLFMKDGETLRSVNVE